MQRAYDYNYPTEQLALLCVELIEVGKMNRPLFAVITEKLEIFEKDNGEWKPVLAG